MRTCYEVYTAHCLRIGEAPLDRDCFYAQMNALAWYECSGVIDKHVRDLDAEREARDGWSKENLR